MALDFLAGCIGGCAGVLVGHPLDTVKVHLQTQDPKNPKYKGTWHCMRTIVAQDKFSGLYRGITSPMGGIGFVNAIVFGIYGNVQRSRTDPDSLTSHALAGGIAGLFQSIVCSPMELAKTRLQLQNESSPGKKFKGPLEYLRYIVKYEGLRGTMRGLMFTAARDIPGFASYFVSYEYMMRQQSQPNVLYGLCAGGLAGICSWLATYPIDVIKTCIQADDAKNPKYRGYMDCIRQGYNNDGWRFFFRGMTSTMIRSFPMNAACFFVVSWIMSWTKKHDVDVVVHTGDTMALVGVAASTPMCHIQNVDHQEDKLREQRSIIAKSLRSFDVFNEAVGHTEVEELATGLYPDTEKYYIFEDERLLIAAADKPIDC
ncbi:mitochondrial basic amino acids transporter [Musca vetustissima]|uniref:mitochondrial basic amino acids transporter n=1 Tax=Musca vetustissima TaxID=27455 RepID=UPI002AB6F66E|nr:mitochondrial basic amino acids transporter [Musca vetustissima]